MDRVYRCICTYDIFPSPLPISFSLSLTALFHLSFETRVFQFVRLQQAACRCTDGEVYIPEALRILGYNRRAQEARDEAARRWRKIIFPTAGVRCASKKYNVTTRPSQEFKTYSRPPVPVPVCYLCLGIFPPVMHASTLTQVPSSSARFCIFITATVVVQQHGLSEGRDCAVAGQQTCAACRFRTVLLDPPKLFLVHLRSKSNRRPGPSCLSHPRLVLCRPAVASLASHRRRGCRQPLARYTGSPACDDSDFRKFKID